MRGGKFLFDIVILFSEMFTDIELAFYEMHVPETITVETPGDFNPGHKLMANCSLSLHLHESVKMRMPILADVSSGFVI